MKQIPRKRKLFDRNNPESSASIEIGMNDELKVNIQWLPGAILPVITHYSDTAADLSNLLQFSCFENEKVYLFHNGEVLTPSLTLKSQGIKKNDVIECKIVSRFYKSDEIIPREKQSIAREMARVLDMRTDKNEPTKEMQKSDSNSSYSDSDSYRFLMMDDSDLTTSNDISSEPLPIIWQSDEQENVIYGSQTNIQDNDAQENTDAKKGVKEKFTW